MPDDYPTLRQCLGTMPTARSGDRVRINPAGPARHRALSTGLRFDLVLVHTAITLDEWTALQDFETAHRGVPFNLYYMPDRSTRSCVFGDRPFDVVPMPWKNGTARFNVTVNLLRDS